MLADLIRSRLVSLLGLVTTILAMTLPPNGLGLPMCGFKAVTHLPCLGCGLTRSFIALGHGHLRLAAAMHPLGLVLFPLAVALAALLVLPSERRERLAQAVEARSGQHDWPFWGFIGLFIIYGIGRIVWILALHHPSIW